MPYRRLPNTDNARLKALKKAHVKGKEIPPFKLAFSQSTYQRVEMFLPTFEHNITLQKHAYSTQVQKNKDYLKKLKKAKLYISHFIQVLNLAIAREEMPASSRSFYGLEDYEKRVPALSTEAEIIDWGKKIIDGEALRIQKGQSPVTNPTIALVRVRYEAFMEAYNHQKTLKKNTHRQQDKLIELREEADDIILNLWNEVEDTFADLPEEEKREKAKEYGLVYVYRKNEIGKIKFFDFNRQVMI
jgi:hypothetical protein